jgi:hypothetical protein
VPRQREGDRHGRVDVRAGEMPGRVDHRHDDQPERGRDADASERSGVDCVGDDRAAACEDERECREPFGERTAHEVGSFHRA